MAMMDTNLLKMDRTEK